jgi:hypothetical protein
MLVSLRQAINTYRLSKYAYTNVTYAKELVILVNPAKSRHLGMEI